MFARSIGDANPKYYEEKDENVIAPPTFIQSSAQFDPDYFLRPKIGGDNWFGSGKEASGMKSSGSGSGGGGGVYCSFEQGGYVGGNRHSQGGTIIEAERGEFVMSRNAVESIGLETLNQMNQSGGGGNINVSVSGNVLTQDFVENELAERIRRAVQRGKDFGIS